MKKARLLRISQNAHGTFGVFLTGGGWWWTMERPWEDNKPFVSCIPTGTYICNKTHSPAFRRDLYLLEGDHKRSGIRIHPGNQVSELQGCIALGNRYTENAAVKKSLVSSGDAMKAFHEIMGGNPFSLVIQNGM